MQVLRRGFRVLCCAALVAAGAFTAQAQFVPERTFVGPSVGLGIGGGLAYGLNGEYAMNENFGLVAGLGLSSFSEDFSGLGVPSGSLPTIDYSFIMGYLGASYHFMPTKKFDPYLSLGIAYMKWDVTYRDSEGKETDPFAGFSAAYTTGVGFTGQLGARYHFSDVVSGRITLGYPMWVGLGVDVAFGGVTPASADGTTPSTSTESAPTESGPRYKLYVGPYVAGKASIKTEVADGTKTGVVFNVPPDFGVSITAPFGAETNIGFGLQFGYATYGYQFKPESNANDSNTVNESYSYINMFPHFNIGGFIVGVNFGFPQSGSTMTIAGDTVSMFGTFTADTVNGEVEYRPSLDPVGPTYDPAKYLGTMVELRIGGSIPIVSSDFGKLKLNIMAGYTLNQIFETAGNYVGVYNIDTSTGNPKLRLDEGLNPVIPSLSLGIQYDFAIGL